MKFFMPSGKKDISAEEFVKYYSEDYFLDNKNQVHIPYLRRSSRDIEKEITAILKDGIKEKRDVARILAWKIGKIKHRKSLDEGQFRYSDDWMNVESCAEQLDGAVRLYSKNIKNFPIGRIASYLLENRDSLESRAKGASSEAQEVLDMLKDEDFDRIGTVYMITLLYFISRGKYPIYDRFAMLALSAIDSEKSPKPGEKVCVDVKFKELPSKESSRFATIMDNEISIYKEKFNEVFGVYKESITPNLTEIELKRKFDQALWVYGHLFTNDQKSASCR